MVPTVSGKQRTRGINKSRHGAAERHFLREAVLVFLGGLAGAALRVVLANFLNFSDFGFYDWNWTYLFINVIGSFAFGFLAALFRVRFPSMRNRWYVFLAEGAVGSFTAFDLVFSQISLIALQPEVWILIFYVGVNFAACIGCSALGVWWGSGKRSAKKRPKSPRHSTLPARRKQGAAAARHGY